MYLVHSFVSFRLGLNTPYWPLCNLSKEQLAIPYFLPRQHFHVRFSTYSNLDPALALESPILFVFILINYVNELHPKLNFLDAILQCYTTSLLDCSLIFIILLGASLSPVSAKELPATKPDSSQCKDSSTTS